MQAHLRASFGAITCALLTAAVLTGGAATASVGPRGHARTWWVQSGAPADGTGSASRPFDSLAEVQAASGPGDRILIVPAAAAAGPLDGGIALQHDQQLLGLGGPVTGLPVGSPAPDIANTTAQDNGDAITLASGSSVHNIAVTAAVRGGIYGDNVSDVSVTGNDISGTNTSCQPGFLIYFPVSLSPTGLRNGWAAIMLDESHGSSTAVISGNYVHHAACADGIDIRTSGTARSAVTINGNDVSRLQQGPAVGSVLALGFQALDSARLTASANANSETSIGSAGADCEGLFTNQTGSSLIDLTIKKNTFAYGIGGASCNGLEAFVGRDAATDDVVMKDSTFTDDPGDMIEENNLGTGSTMNLNLDHVTVSDTTISKPEVTTPDPAFGQLTGHGDCINQFTTGPQATSSLTVSDSSISNCGNDGIFAFANTPPAAAAASAAITVNHTSISAAKNYGLHWVNYGAIGWVRIDMSHDLFVNNTTADAAFDAATGATTQHAAINLGTSVRTGCNSFLSIPLALETTGYPVTAQYNWWGQPVPSPAQIAAAGGGGVATDPPLNSPAC